MNFLYCITHDRYVGEFKRSLSSLRSCHPKSPVYVYTQFHLQANIADKYVTLITPNTIHKGFLDKIEAIDAAPKPCLYLDTDTYVLEPVDALYGVLESHSFAGVRAPIRYSRTDVDVPCWFPEINGGVLLFGDDDTAANIIKEWKKLQIEEEEDEGAHVFRHMVNDQSTLRRTTFKYINNVFILPEEYNMRCNFPFVMPGNSTPKIMHARGEDLDQGLEAAKKKTFKPRGFLKSESSNETGDRSLFQRIASYLSRNV
jgi:hypothetical protein